MTRPLIRPENHAAAAALEAQDTLILDGGLATWAEELGAALDPQLWSAGLLLEGGRDMLSRVYQDFLAAGADCIATATYQASFEGLAGKGLGTRQAAAVLTGAVALARAATERFWQGHETVGRLRPMVAASIGPYGAFLADGSEYRGDYAVGESVLREFHRDRLEILAAADPDWIALETFPSAVEIRAVVALLDDMAAPPPAWLALSCRNSNQLADGTDLAEIRDQLRHPALLAVGINCCPPSRVDGVLRTLGGLVDKPLVAYPNSGEVYAAEEGSWRGASESLEQRAPAWRQAGARLIGGCCRTTPADIARLRAALVGS